MKESCDYVWNICVPSAKIYFLFTAVPNKSKMAKENTPERPIPKLSSGTVTKSTSGTRISFHLRF